MPALSRRGALTGLSVLLALAPLPARPLSVPADCDYLVVTDSLLLPEAKRLADFRAGTDADQIKKPFVATMADIEEDNPTHGPKARAIILFLNKIHAANGKLPEHLLLFGDASADASSPENRVPSYFFQPRSPVGGDWNNPIYDTVATDDVYACLLDSVPVDTMIPRTAVGRIPAGSLSQAKAVVDKIIAYETQGPYGPNAFTHAFLNDDDRQAGSQDGLDPIHNMLDYPKWLWDSVRTKPFVRRVPTLEFPLEPDTTKPKARDSLISLLQEGPARLYFTGHGNQTQLTDEKVFAMPGDLDRLKPPARHPIAAMLTTRAANFAWPHGLSLGEGLLFHPSGIIAMLGATWETYPMPNNALFINWQDTASRGGTLGRSFTHAKAGIAKQDPMYSVVFTLIGDPALTLHTPTVDLAPATGSGQTRLVLQGAGAAGDSVYCETVQTDSVLLDPFLHPANDGFKGRRFERETVFGRTHGVLGPGGSVSLDLPNIPDPRAGSVKVLTWNSKGMRYGHFPLSDLGPIAVRKTPGATAAKPAYRLVLQGTAVRVEWTRPGPRGNLRKTFDLRGSRR